MRKLRNVMFVLFVVVAVGTGQLSASTAAEAFASQYSCDSPTYWSVGQCDEGAVTLYCTPGEIYPFFCDDAASMCSSHCGQYSAEGNLGGCYANEFAGGAHCECMGVCE